MCNDLKIIDQRFMALRFRHLLAPPARQRMGARREHFEIVLSCDLPESHPILRERLKCLSRMAEYLSLDLKLALQQFA